MEPRRRQKGTESGVIKVTITLKEALSEGKGSCVVLEKKYT